MLDNSKSYIFNGTGYSDMTELVRAMMLNPEEGLAELKSGRLADFFGTGNPRIQYLCGTAAAGLRAEGDPESYLAFSRLMYKLAPGLRSVFLGGREYAGLRDLSEALLDEAVNVSIRRYAAGESLETAKPSPLINEAAFLLQHGILEMYAGEVISDTRAFGILEGIRKRRERDENFGSLLKQAYMLGYAFSSARKMVLRGTLFKDPRDLCNRLAEYCRHNGISRDQFIRETSDDLRFFFRSMPERDAPEISGIFRDILGGVIAEEIGDDKGEIPADTAPAKRFNLKKKSPPPPRFQDGGDSEFSERSPGGDLPESPVSDRTEIPDAPETTAFLKCCYSKIFLALLFLCLLLVVVIKFNVFGFTPLGPSQIAVTGIEDRQLTIWVDDYMAYDGIAKVGKKFEQATGVKVTVEHPEGADKKFQQTAAAGNGPDIFMWSHDRFGEWAKQKLLAQIEPSPEEKSRFADFAWEAMKVDGKYYGYPVFIETTGLICNRAIVRDAPRAFEDFIALDDRLKAEGKRAIMWDYNNGYFSYPLISANGGYAYRKTAAGYDVKDSGVNTYGAKKGVNFLVDLINSGHMEKGIDYGVMDSSFVNGKVACIINGPWSWGNYDIRKLDISVNAIPSLNGRKAHPLVGVHGMTISAASPNKDLAREFLEKYLLTDEGFQAMYDDRPRGVAALSSFEKKLEADPRIGSRIAATRANAEAGHLIPNVAEMNRFWAAFQTALTYSTKGRQTVDEALSTAERYISQSTVAQNTVTGIEDRQLTIWVNGDMAYDGIAKVGRKFEQATGVKVTVEHPDGVENKFQQTAAAGKGPDLFMWSHDRFGEWAKQKLLAPIQPSPEEKARFADFAWEAMKVDGRYYGYPVFIETTGLICNRAIVRDAPRAFEDFIALDDRLKAEGKRAIMWDYNNGYFSYPLISANGGYAFRKTAAGYDVKDSGVNTYGAKKGVNFLVDLINSGHMEKGVDYGVMDSSFVNGKVACIINGPWSWGNYDIRKIDFSVNAIPSLNGRKARPLVGVQGMTINAASPNKDLARKFLEKYLLTDEGFRAMNDDRPHGVAALSSFEKKLEADPRIGSRIAATRVNAEAGHLMPNVTEMNRFWSSFQTALTNSTKGRQTVDEALSTAERRIEQ